jgi:hypothetical protein
MVGDSSWLGGGWVRVEVSGAGGIGIDKCPLPISRANVSRCPATAFDPT